MRTQTSETVGVGPVAKSVPERGALLWIRAGGVVGFALATAAGACVAIPLPGTPVPMTLQTLSVVLAGLTLGPRLGMLSMAFYLLLGSTGYHVFAGGNWGLSTIFGATGGYLVGFLLAQPVIGTLARPGQRGWSRLLAALLAGNAIIFACGLAWLASWSGAGFQQTLAWGLGPFVPGLIVKTAAALAIAPLATGRARGLFNRG